jgi:hypothetical protein
MRQGSLRAPFGFLTLPFYAFHLVVLAVALSGRAVFALRASIPDAAGHGERGIANVHDGDAALSKTGNATMRCAARA